MNKKLMAKVVAATPPLVGVEGYSEVVLNAMGATPTMGFTFGGNKTYFNYRKGSVSMGFLLQNLRGREG